MPINDPIKGKKVAPASLAFEHGKATRGPSAVTYQSLVRIAAAEAGASGNIDRNGVIRRVAQGAKQSVHAERRAKHYTGEFGSSFNWDITSNITVTLPIFIVPFNHEVLRAIGAHYYDDGTAGVNSYWRHQPPKGDLGTWMYHTRIAIQLPTTTQCTRAGLALYKNGFCWHELDCIDLEYTGDTGTEIRDIILQGSDVVNLETAGDYVDVRIALTMFGGGSQTFGYPTSIQGYVCGSLQRCGQSEEDNTDPSDGYVFV